MDQDLGEDNYLLSWFVTIDIGLFVPLAKPNL